jgi:sugar O-acyltransferase (sialic acid O-acetyltransferase NeuD family)
LTRNLAILAAAGHARVVADSAAASGWDVTFFDDSLTGVLDGWPIAGAASDFDRQAKAFDGAVVGTGNNRARSEWTLRLQAAGVPLRTVIDPTARVSTRAEIGAGSFLAAGSVVNISAILSRACITNTTSTVDHDCHPEDGVHLSPGVHLSGPVSIGSRSWLGTGAAVRNNLRIGKNVISGVGSVIIAEISDELVVAGVPAGSLEKA